MTVYKYGDDTAQSVLIQPVDQHDLESIENEIAIIKANTKKPFCLFAVKVDDWNNDLSPWEAPAVFGKQAFGGAAHSALEQILRLCSDSAKTYFIGGYSLAGLFALWAVYNSHTFKGAAAASPSVWFKGFIDYMKLHDINAHSVYLSLGDKEDKTRNPLMATVKERICQAHSHLESCGIRCTLEWNQGNHFKDADIRTAKAFAWVLNNS